MLAGVWELPPSITQRVTMATERGGRTTPPPEDEMGPIGKTEAGRKANGKEAELAEEGKSGRLSECSGRGNPRNPEEDVEFFRTTGSPCRRMSESSVPELREAL